ncbi:A disintegrin and metalloproteinase with thrombospondin motifs 20-like isoform X2 [Corticium candelabrum]|uniref:A disintegrin and metalloproteinase with thrombospondin motifs 20-like isoform X2 n=1 Tax=Corticium candelabrum TaxID=121492 RepID=UPI002E258699|nr:A disintegrin and metalloproteinase with thrombospondin motifs 20-like isoform X2 [Corticium candelabrum]
MFSWSLRVLLPLLLLQMCRPLRGSRDTSGPLTQTQAHGTLTLADEEWQPVPWVQAKQYTGHNIIAAVSGNTYYITLTDVGRPGKTGMEETVDTPHNCLYTGHLYNSSFQAMISLCPLVYGFFETEEVIFLIEPFPRYHSYKELVNATISVIIHHHVTHHLDLSSANSSTRTGRRATLTLPITIKLMVTPGRYLSDSHRIYSSYIGDYLLTVIAIVNSLFRDPTLGSRVVIAVTKEDTNAFDVNYGDDVGSILHRYCEYQNNQRNLSESDYDMAILFVGYTAPEVRWNDETGLTYSHEVCNNETSCGVVRDIGMNSAFIVARMIGLWLGLSMDGLRDNNCSQINRRSGIMSPFLDRTNLWSWSSCSKAELQAILSQTTATHDPILCLRDKASGHFGLLPRHPAAFRNTLHRHCVMRYHLSARACYDNTTRDCKEMRCSIYNRPCSSPIYLVHWPDETPCGNTSSKIKMFCYQRECLNRSAIKELKRLKAVYSEWSEWSECSRSCGGGIQISKRTCTGGLGDCRNKQTDIRAESCNLEDCPYSKQSFREEQCSKYNAGNITWYPVYKRGNQEECKLHCETKGGIQLHKTVIVIDGTRCNANSFDVCVQGSCKPAGCDHRVMATSVLDKCGVCRGNGSSCILNKGHTAGDKRNFIKTKYVTVLTVPAGSSGIDILKRERGTSDPHCFLAVHETVGRVLFKVKEGMKTAVFYGAGLLWTYRPLIFTSRQRLTVYGALTTAVTIKMRCSRQAKEYDVTWSYYKRLPPFDVFEWHLNRNCSREYRGKRLPTWECYRLPHRDLVNETNCSQLPKPSSLVSYDSCNPDYDYVWQINRICPSSLDCGDGSVAVVIEYKCFRLSLQSHQLSVDPVDDEACSQPKPDNDWVLCDRIPCGSHHGHIGIMQLSIQSKCTTSCGVGYKPSMCKFIPVRKLTKGDIRCWSQSEDSLQRMPCSGNVCPQNESASSCAAWQRKGFRDDGEYTINKQGKILQLYCYGMAKGNPLEYLTLPSGPSKNFGHIYSYQWNKAIAPCPVNYTRLNFINYTDRGSSQFSKVRIHLNSMEIQTDDFTFAETAGSIPEFGMAGGCFVTSNCTGVTPNGYFSVDLQGTGLEVSDLNQWHVNMTKGPQTYMPMLSVGSTPVSFQVVTGWCGLCSKCFIAGQRLKVNFVVPM